MPHFNEPLSLPPELSWNIKTDRRSASKVLALQLSLSIIVPPVFMTPGESLTFPIASLKDIAAMKAVGISQRRSLKGFIDLYYKLRATTLSFDEISSLTIKKYGLSPHYDDHLRTSFVYFDDAEREVDQVVMLEEGKEKCPFSAQEWDEINLFFKELVK